jgi:hypothetical protein
MAEAPIYFLFRYFGPRGGTDHASSTRYAMSSDWKNEDDIKAELRAMTDELRRLRQGLRNMVSPPKPNPSRAFLHRQSWPEAVEPAAEPVETKPAKPVEPPKAEAADRGRRAGKKKPR